MPTQESPATDTPKTWKHRLGMILIVYSFIPLCTVELVAFLGVPASQAVTLGAFYVASGEIAFLLAVALLGKPFVMAVKAKIKGFFFRSKTDAAPQAATTPRHIGRVRHAFGVVLFVLSIVPYYATMAVLFVAHPKEPDLGALLWLLVAGEALFLISLFVLGEEFWAKLKHLFEWPGKEQPARAQA